MYDRVINKWNNISLLWNNKNDKKIEIYNANNKCKIDLNNINNYWNI